MRLRFALPLISVLLAGTSFTISDTPPRHRNALRGTIVGEVLAATGAPMPSAVSEESAELERAVNAEIEHVVLNHQLMTDLLVMALACDQTRVANMMFNNDASSLTRIGSTITRHQLTHEEVLDRRLGRTLQQAMGVSVDRWGSKSMETGKSIGELLA